MKTLLPNKLLPPTNMYSLSLTLLKSIGFIGICVDIRAISQAQCAGSGLGNMASDVNVGTVAAACTYGTL